MRNFLVILLTASLAFWGGCFKVDVPKSVDVNIKDNTGGNSGGETMAVPTANDGGGSMFSQAKDAAKKMSDSEFYADDVLSLPGKSVDLKVHCDLEDVENKTVALEYKFGGKTFSTLKVSQKSVTSINWTPPAVGIYNITVTASFVDEKTRLPQTRSVGLTVCVAPADAPIMIVDLDHTIVGSGFFKVVMRLAQPMPDAAGVMCRLARKYTVVYLTHRPAMLTNLSKKWLTNYGFPAGPLLTNQENEFSSGDYKGEYIRKLRGEFKNIRVGVGDKASDMQAYRVNGMKAFWIIKYKDKRKSVEKIIKTIRPYREDKGIEVVFAWEQIEQSLNGQKSFTIEVVSKQLHRRADELRRDEKDKKNKDDDEDDD